MFVTNMFADVVLNDMLLAKTKLAVKICADIVFIIKKFTDIMLAGIMFRPVTFANMTFMLDGLKRKQVALSSLESH